MTSTVPIRYSRYLDASLADRIAKDVSFLMLREAAKSSLGYLSLLEGNKVQLNYGTTRIARVEYGKSIDRYFTYHPKTPVDHSLSLAEIKISANAVSEQRPGYLKEGKIQDDICRDGYCIEPQNKKRWVIIDREAVIGFLNKGEKANFWKNIKESVSASALETREPEMRKTKKRWGRFKPPGDECDLLAISEDGELVCLEVKHGTNSDLEWAPYQALGYREAFQKAAPSISDGIRAMVRQKVRLGLVDAETEKFLPSSSFKRVIAAVIIGRKDTASATKLGRLEKTASAVGSSIQVLEYASDPKLIGC